MNFPLKIYSSIKFNKKSSISIDTGIFLHNEFRQNNWSLFSVWYLVFVSVIFVDCMQFEQHIQQLKHLKIC